VSAAGDFVGEPVNRGDVFVGAGHFYAGYAGDGGGGFAGGRDGRVGPVEILEDAEIHGFDFGGRRAIAAVEPDEDAGMLAQNVDLAFEGGGGDFFLVGVPIFPAFPGVAAGPTGHDEDAETIGFFVELFAVEAAFEANRVHAHVADVGEIGVEFAGDPAEEKVGGPGGSADEDIEAVNFEEAEIFVG
jgi:hypothetical protein